MPIFFPNNFFQKTDFDFILSLLKNKCQGEIGQASAENPFFYEKLGDLEQELKWVAELGLMINLSVQFPHRGFKQLASEIQLLKVEQAFLSINAFIEIYFLAEAIEILKKIASNAEQKGTFDIFVKKIKTVGYQQEIKKEIERVIDIETQNINESCSPELRKIRNEIRAKEQESLSIFRKMVRTLKQKDMLAESEETIRNGRRVLSIKATFKRQVAGIFQDESSNGSITFIEPQETIFINNEIAELQVAERREIERILKELGRFVGLYVDDIEEYGQFMGYFDFSRAKASLSNQLDGKIPKLTQSGKIQLRNLVHPVLYIHHTKSKKPTVPSSLNFDAKYRVLIISGPNAGGKSIALKSMFLAQLMLQIGMPIPADEASEMRLFSKFFIDIGDQQSVENDLSTYSSHLKNMHYFLQNGDKDTLFGIDEMGAGTDPSLGGALAEAVLEELNKKEITGIVTTHYSNLKVFASVTEGFFNGAMAFDLKSLKPLFQLNIGSPGSSFTFEVARNSGLPSAVLTLAKSKISEQKKDLEITLTEIQNEKQYLKGIRKNAQSKETQLDEIKKQYDVLKKDLEKEKKKIIKAYAEKKLEDYNEANRKLEKMMREFRESEHKKQKFDEIRKFVDLNRNQLEDGLADTAAVEALQFTDDPIQVGDFVNLDAGLEVGRVNEIRKNIAIVAFGNLNTQVKLEKLTKVVKNTVAPQKVYNTSKTIEEKAAFNHELDIRGLFKDTAMQALESFLDDALMYGFGRVKIIHGKGTGVLKQMVYSYLKGYNGVSKFYAEDSRFGGDGATIVEF